MLPIYKYGGVHMTDFNYIEDVPFQPNSVFQDNIDLLKLLLVDRTTSTQSKTKNIIWASEDYLEVGKSYSPSNQMTIKQITGKHADLIIPRSMKSKEVQKDRTKKKAEVFTPTWVIKKQNESVEESFIDDDLLTYLERTWLEITCGEGPYITTRYDMYTGEINELSERVGFLDKKFQRLNESVDDKDEWMELAHKIYKSTYGFEWSGDSLLLARENILLTFIDNYHYKFNEYPSKLELEGIIEIITYNIFQMDGLKYIIPLSMKEVMVSDGGIVFPGEEEKLVKKIIPGTRVKVMDWKTNTFDYFMDEKV